MSDRGLLAQLYIMRAQLDFAIAIAEKEHAVAASSAPTTCAHPEDKRVDTSAMGGGPSTFICLDCGTEVGGGAGETGDRASRDDARAPRPRHRERDRAVRAHGTRRGARA